MDATALMTRLNPKWKTKVKAKSENKFIINEFVLHQSNYKQPKKAEDLKATPPLQNYFCLTVALDMQLMNLFILKKKKCFLLEISRFLCFCKIHIFQNLWHHHRHCYIMEVIIMLIYFESSVLSKWKLVKY